MEETRYTQGTRRVDTDRGFTEVALLLYAYVHMCNTFADSLVTMQQTPGGNAVGNLRFVGKQSIATREDGGGELVCVC